MSEIVPSNRFSRSMTAYVMSFCRPWPGVSSTSIALPIVHPCEEIVAHPGLTI